METVQDPYTDECIRRLVEVQIGLEAMVIKTEIPEAYRKVFGDYLKSVREAIRELRRLDGKLAKIHAFSGVNPGASRALQERAAARRQGKQVSTERVR